MFSTYKYKLRTHNDGRYKGRTVQTSDVQSSDWDKHQTSTNVRPVQTSDCTNVRQVQTSDHYKLQTMTNVRTVQTSDQYKRQTSTNVGPVQTSDQYKRRTKEKKYLNFKIKKKGISFYRLV